MWGLVTEIVRVQWGVGDERDPRASDGGGVPPYFPLIFGSLPSINNDDPLNKSMNNNTIRNNIFIVGHTGWAIRLQYISRDSEFTIITYVC